MTSVMLRIVITVVRVWTRLYTWRMDATSRDRRLAEIESDLWECQAVEHDRLRLAIQITQRLVLGVFSDVRWRLEQSTERFHLARQTVFAFAATVVIVAIWVVLAVRPTALPQPPAAPDLVSRRTPYPPPPPPPPPPCPPPGVGRPTVQPCTP